MKLVKLISILAFILIPSSVLAQDKEHDDKERAKAEKNLDHAHWKKAHGNGVPQNQPKRSPPSGTSKETKPSRAVEK